MIRSACLRNRCRFAGRAPCCAAIGQYRPLVHFWKLNVTKSAFDASAPGCGAVRRLARRQPRARGRWGSREVDVGFRGASRRSRMHVELRVLQAGPGKDYPMNGLGQIPTARSMRSRCAMR